MMERKQTSGDRRHPPDGAWRAYADGEMALPARLRLRTHAAACGACRERLARVQAEGVRTSQLLGRLTTATDVGDGWARMAVRSGRRARATLPSRVPAFLAGGFAAASLAVSILVLHPGPTRMLGRLHGADTFTTVLDRCCSDDPATESPTGVFRLELAGMGSPLEVTYSDVDGSGTLSQGDIVRTITRAGRR